MIGGRSIESRRLVNILVLLLVASGVYTILSYQTRESLPSHRGIKRTSLFNQVEFGDSDGMLSENTKVNGSIPSNTHLLFQRYPYKLPPDFTEEMKDEIYYKYLMDEKGRPYVGAKKWLDKFEKGSTRWFNSYCVFSGFNDDPSKGPLRMHGLIGLREDYTPVYQVEPKPVSAAEVEGGIEKALKDGGFYLPLSNALPLDREPIDSREDVCRKAEYDIETLPMASIVITFYNEPISTLIRTVHSVLNQTPPPLLKEIILVDDHSNLTDNLPGSKVYEHLMYLPKTKILRLPERKGLVHARLAGARVSSADVLVVLDSHVEVNRGWLEPQLQRIKESPNSIVFPQILGINSENFEYEPHSGIGCRVGFKWSMVESSSLTARVDKTDPIPSPSMAGGLFAVDLDYFWHIGGYDEGFTMWGAENVEMGFRVWLCGGRLECTPCARTYHIYRKKGHGYTSPKDSVTRNRLRTALVWTDEFYEIARLFVGSEKTKDLDIGPIDKMLKLKNDLKCKNFKYFLDNVETDHYLTSLDSIQNYGEVINLSFGSVYCLDTMSNSDVGKEIDVFPCHHEGGTQNWIFSDPYLTPVTNEHFCIDDNKKFKHCKDRSKDMHWELIEDDPGRHSVKIKNSKTGNCLGIARSNGTKLITADCNAKDTIWKFEKFHPGAEYEAPTFSPDYIRKQKIFQSEAGN